MAKLKDGFYKLTASSIGSDLLVLLAGGGAKPISDFASAFNVKIWGLDFDGSSDVAGDLLLGASKILGKDSADIVNAGSNHLVLGYGSSEKGWPTYVDGNPTYFRYGTSHSVGMFLDSSGKVGIGNIAPQQKLDVSGKIKADALYLTRSNGDVAFTIAEESGTNGYNITASGGSSFIRFYTNSGGSSAVERMRIHTNGFVGIGTPSPNMPLTINGATWINSGGYINNRATLILNSNNTANNAADIVFKKNSSTAANYGHWAISARYDSTYRFSIFRGVENGSIASEAELFTLRPDGDVDIKGTINLWNTTCTQNHDEGIRLHASSTGWNALVFCGTDNTGDVGTSAKTWGIYTNIAGDFFINKNSSSGLTAAVLCNVGNNWGIGTISPTYKLHVAGSVWGDNLYSNDVTLYTRGSGTYTRAWICAKDDAGDFIIEAPLTTDSASGTRAPITLTWRGGFPSKGGLKITGESTAQLGSYTILHTGNYTGTLDGRYVNVTGDTMTGNLTVPSLNSYYLFRTTDIAEGAANLGTLATPHTITFFRNGIMIPYKMDNANDGGMIRTKGASEDSCVFEMATWDDSGDGETIQFNYYSTTSQLTPTYSNTVPKVSGTLLNSGNWPSYIGGHGYLMNEYTIDATGLDLNTWYPVTMAIGACLNVRIEVRVSLNSGSKPSWSTHGSGFAVRKIWEVNGSGWGTNPVHRTVFVSDYAHASADPVRGMGDMGYSSTEYVYVRGGGRYYFYTSHNITPYLRTSTYVGTADPYYLAISPTTTAPGTIAGFLINRSMYASHFYENSDIKLKENINLISSSDNIPLLKEFNWKSDGKHSYGLIAQELEEMGYSELVEESGDHKTVNYSAALSLIVGKLQVKIKELEKEIEILKNKN